MLLVMLMLSRPFVLLILQLITMAIALIVIMLVVVMFASVVVVIVITAFSVVGATAVGRVDGEGHHEYQRPLAAPVLVAGEKRG